MEIKKTYPNTFSINKNTLFVDIIGNDWSIEKLLKNVIYDVQWETKSNTNETKWYIIIYIALYMYIYQYI